MRGSLTVVINQHQELCALHKPGGLPISPAQMCAAVQAAAAVVPERLLALERALEEHAARVAAAAATLAKTGRMPARAASTSAAPLSIEGAGAEAVPPPVEPAAEAAAEAAPSAPETAAGVLDSDEEERTGTVRSAFEAGVSAKDDDAPAPSPPPSGNGKPSRAQRKRARKGAARAAAAPQGEQ